VPTAVLFSKSWASADRASARSSRQRPAYVGVEALSMRVLAQRLGSGTAPYYRHFGNRAALVARVVDEVRRTGASAYLS
jgi:AcrR family transcriptional regulator